MAEGPDSPLLAPVTMAVLPLRSTGQASGLQLFLPRAHSSARRAKEQMNQSGWERRAAPSISGSFQEQPWKVGADPGVQAEKRPLAFRKRKGPKAALLWAESTFNKRPAHFLDRSHAAELWEGQLDRAGGGGGEEKLLLLLFLAQG